MEENGRGDKVGETAKSPVELIGDPVEIALPVICAAVGSERKITTTASLIRGFIFRLHLDGLWAVGQLAFLLPTEGILYYQEVTMAHHR